MMYRSVLHYVVLACCWVCLAGCVETTYRVELTPDDGEMSRRLMISSSTTSEDDSTPSLSSEERQRIEGAYPGVLSYNDDGELEISGVFGLDMPDDVGGVGSYLYLESPMGSVSYYSERFRGSFDLTSGMDEAEDRVDSTIDLLSQWAEQNFGEGPEELRFKQWVNETLRQDAKNLMRLAWAHRVASDLGNSPDMKSWAAYSIQYLHEHDYLSLGDVPKVTRMTQGQDSQAIVQWVASVVFSKLKIDQAAISGSSLAILRDADALAESLRAFLRETPAYQQQLADENLTGDGSADDSTSQPDPLGVLGNAVWLALMGTRKEEARANVEVSLQTDVEPFETNGVFDHESHQTVWETSLNDRFVPMLAFATWAEPNVEYQDEKLGRSFLKDQDLAEYVVWCHGIDAEERRQWDTVFEDCESPESLKQAISDFEFASQTGLADIPRGLMESW